MIQFEILNAFHQSLNKKPWKEAKAARRDNKFVVPSQLQSTKIQQGTNFALSDKKEDSKD